MKYKKIPLQDYINIYSKVPRLCVDLIVKTQDGIILTKRNIPPFKGMWHLPGGTLLMHEPLLHAVKRVAKEELGIQPLSIQGPLGPIEYPFNPPYDNHSIALTYVIDSFKGVITHDEQATDAKAFKELPSKIIGCQKKFLLNMLK